MTRKHPYPGDVFLYCVRPTTSLWSVIMYVVDVAQPRGSLIYATYEIREKEWWISDDQEKMRYDDYLWLQDQGHIEFIGNVGNEGT